MVTALVTKITVFTPVTAMGKRGWNGGGQIGLPKRNTMYAPMSPAKNIASAPRNMSTASQALLPTGAFGRTGGEGGIPPPNAGRFAFVSGSSMRRAFELWVMEQPLCVEHLNSGSWSNLYASSI
jgi:hypothetical protein